MPKGNGFGITSVDGRAHLSNIKPINNQMKFTLDSIMTFKCHKQGEGNEAILYPVHDIFFHPGSMGDGFVSTCAGDGFMIFWDFK
jgi:hypothetical protein